MQNVDTSAVTTDKSLAAKAKSKKRYKKRNKNVKDKPRLVTNAMLRKYANRRRSENAFMGARILEGLH